MSFDQKTRNLLQRTVSACRKILDEEFAAQRREVFGINDDGTAAPLELLGHLPDEDMQTAKLLRDRLDHLVAGLTTQGKKESDARKEAVGRLTREQAFTVLNRLAALRMSEEREIVLECVRNGLHSEGFLLFQQTAGSAFGETWLAYRAYLLVLFDELALDLGVLFSRWDPAGLLFPGKDALEAVLQELGGTGTAMAREDITPEEFNAIWSEDETIGWIYQYYNDQAERKKMREESAAPRNGRELAVRNQFFTPRYVVEFLTDNTLGRIWYEMTQGDTNLKEQCRYLVRRPNEIFLAAGESPPENLKPETENLSQEELLRQPVHIPHRPLKDPRTILMLDPACGSMHFGLYAFDLFEVIYDEAWDLAETHAELRSLTSDFSTKEEFLRQVPRLIIEHNIHGIDIDPRAAQIAGLALWLRAQKAWQRLGLKQAERPAIRRSNIVCAEPMPGEKELLREFVEREFPAAERAVCLRLLEAIFDKMQLAGEAGSLLKIEEEIRSAIEDARDAWQKLATKPQELFTTTELNQLSTAPELTGLEQAVSSLTTAPRHLTTEFWERIEERIYAALRDYAEQAENGGGFQRRLFAEDAARGFAFIDVCRKRYDVALMNPPFGEASIPSRKYSESAFGDAAKDLYVAFLARAKELLVSHGRAGAISSRTAFFLSSFRRFREEILFKSILPAVVADLGAGVLDAATVETAAYCLELGRDPNLPATFIQLLQEQDKGEALARILGGQFGDGTIAGICLVRPKQFLHIPGAPLCYWISDRIRAWFVDLKPLSENGLHACVTNPAGDDTRYFRASWEVSQGTIGRIEGWVPLMKGGSFRPFYSDLHLLVAWDYKKTTYKGFIGTEHRPLEKPASVDRFFKPGLTWPRRTNGLSFRVLPGEAIFADKGPAIFSESDDHASLIAVCAVLNSIPFLALVSLQLGRVDLAQSFEVGLIKQTPFPEISSVVESQLKELSSGCIKLSQEGERMEEVSHLFVGNWFSRLRFSAIEKAASEISNDRGYNRKTYQQNIAEIDELCFALYGASQTDRNYLIESCKAASLRLDPRSDCATPIDVSEALVGYLLGATFGRWDIRYATGEQAAPELPDPFAPLPVCPPGQLQNAQGLPARPEDVPAAYPVRIPWDGILVDDPNHPLDIERRVLEVIEIIWSGQEGGPTADAIEHEACEILGVKSLRDYFRKPTGFFADHLKRYSKSRRQAPIYWPLSTASGSYTLWLYYHRLTNDTLYKCLQDFVEPKIAELEKDLHRYRTMVAADEAGTRERKQLADAETLLDELRALHTDLTHWAPRWKPNLNDGVQITASPLWKLFRLPKWQKTLKETWQKLEKSDYDWAHLALTLWPDRVREKCKKDRSLAIAHDLEEFCEVKPPAPKKKRAEKKAGKTPREEELL
jgi:hypothetical protein